MSIVIPYVVQCGLISGIIMSVVAIAAQLLKVTRIDLTRYLGCLLTGQPSGINSFVSGVSFHMLMSVVFAYIYVFLINFYGLQVSIMTGIILGTINTLFSGTMLYVTDALNPCIVEKRYPAMGMFASGYGFVSGVLIYYLLHVVYAVSFCLLYA